FTSPEWCNIFFKEWVNKINIKNEDIFNIYEINKRIHDYNTLKYNENFNHLLSIAIWLET
ncbi:MAG TPA: hypothetical protein DFI01_03720, partial [Bacteroidales bacterium]|nr:hypothetical protein [Bacteroidales bacterium]